MQPATCNKMVNTEKEWFYIDLDLYFCMFASLNKFLFGA